MQIVVVGRASKKTILDEKVDSFNGTLMDYLHSKKIPIASSCVGEGVCQRCSVRLNDDNKLSCLVLIEYLIKTHHSIKIEIDYL